MATANPGGFQNRRRNKLKTNKVDPTRQPTGPPPSGPSLGSNLFPPRGVYNPEPHASELNGYTPQPHDFGKERFNHRQGKHRGNKDTPKGDTWKPEHELIVNLTDNLHLNGGGGRGKNNDGGVGRLNNVPRNELVTRFENDVVGEMQDWRQMPELPTMEELSRDGVEVPCNIIDDMYDSVEEYLNTHYELLREDAVAGLRDAVAWMKVNPHGEDTQAIGIYDDVRVIGMTYTTNFGVCAKVSFHLNRQGKRVRWSQSKRLLPGGLVLLSEIDENTGTSTFEEFRVATVAARPLAGVESTPYEVDLQFQPGEIEIDASKRFVMIECKSSYFEAYKHVLKALQKMHRENFPLARHICYLDKELDAPEYVKKNPTYNLNSICPDSRDKERLEEVDILRNWPKTLPTTMDKSQLNALRQILTKEVAVIQGPPGTGKTYTSVQALHALMNNMAEEDPPIIVACQTNHALDQILRHIYKFESNIIRLGGRTQDKDEILSRTLYNVRRNSRVNVVGSNVRSLNRQLETVKEQMMAAMRPLCEDLISEQGLYELGLINKKQLNSFEAGSSAWVQARRDENPQTPIAIWLADSIEQVYEPEELEQDIEEADIEYEALKDIEAEFLAGGGIDKSDDSDELYGKFMGIKNKFYVRPEQGVELPEIFRAIRQPDLWSLAPHLRAAAYLHWRSEALTKIAAKMRQLHATYQKLCADLRIAKMEKDSYLLSQCKLVGMTTTGLSKYRSLVASVKPKVVLIEEAAEVLEGPVVVACLPSVEQLILVGDHKQLRGHCAVHDLDNEPYNLNISLFERWVNNSMPYIGLQIQRRMRPEIREILTPIYHDQLRDHESVLGRDPIKGMSGTNLFWFCHSFPEETFDDSPSKCNYHEAAMINKFVEYLIFNGTPPGNITILTFYTGQRHLLARTLGRNPNLKNTFIQIATVDSFQGEENDIIILSLVRSNPEGKIGFLSIDNRICVALSRAQRGLYIFGNGELVTKHSNLWWDIGNLLQTHPVPPLKIGFQLPLTCHNHKTRTLVEHVGDWDELSGGCKKRCGMLLPCGHRCPLNCHPFDHSEYRCLMDCNREPLCCGHRCEGVCWRECECTRCGVTRGIDETLNVRVAEYGNAQRYNRGYGAASDSGSTSSGAGVAYDKGVKLAEVIEDEEQMKKGERRPRGKKSKVVPGMDLCAGRSVWVPGGTAPGVGVKGAGRSYAGAARN